MNAFIVLSQNLMEYAENYDTEGWWVYQKFSGQISRRAFNRTNEENSNNQAFALEKYEIKDNQNQMG